MFIAEAYSVACDCIETQNFPRLLLTFMNYISIAAGGSFNYLGYEVGDQLQSSKTYN